MRPRLLLLASTILILLLASTEALAQRAPDMATLDRGDGISKLALDFGYTALDPTPYDGALRFELHGQYVTESALGFYGALPLALSFGDDDDPPGDQDDLALGGLELGLLYIIDSPTVSWVFRGGVVAPTADASRDGALTNSVARWPRLTDTARAVPDAWYLRPAISLLLHAHKLSLRADLGFDLGIDHDDFLRLNVGGGLDLGVVALSLELVNQVELDDIDGDEDVVHTLTFTVRFMTERFEPFIALGAPLDDSSPADFFLAAGLQFPL